MRKFLTRLENHFQTHLKEDSTPLKDWKEKAWAQAVKMGLPQKKQGAYQYLPLSQFYQESFATASDVNLDKKKTIPFCHSESSGSTIVFVNGRFSKKLSDLSSLPKQVQLFPLHEAFQSYGMILKHRLDTLLQEEKDSLALLNLAFEREGLFLFIPPKVKLSQPIHFLQLISCQSPTHFSPRMHIFLGKEAEAKAIFSTISLSREGFLNNSFIDLTLEDAAQFESIHTNQFDHEKGWYFDGFRATLKKNSQLKNFYCTLGSKCVRHDAQMALIGEGARAELKGIWMLKGSRQSHVHVRMEHKAPHTQSLQLFKGILEGSCQSSFEGKIFVDHAAQKTEAYQLNHNLILSKNAIANCKPNLEIFADDVKASHGATVSQLNEEQLFYLKTRGLSNDMAKNFLILGFCKELLDQISYPKIQEELKEYTQGFIQ